MFGLVSRTPCLGNVVRPALRVAQNIPCRCLVRLKVDVSASARLGSLRRLLFEKDIVRVMEVHNGLGALIAQTAKAKRSNGEEVKFDALWSSSLTSSASKGKPDIETVDTSERLAIVQDVLEVSNLPVLYDGDTGGLPEVFKFTVKTLERLGVSACIIEDKKGLKQNSLFGTEREQQLEDIPVFCEKIKSGQAAKATDDFMIIARLEALIAGYGEAEALKRAKAYIEAGADGIMIHSKEKKPDEILSFLREYSKFPKRVPVVAVPTTYNSITEEELGKSGVGICIYANQMLRAAYPSMVNIANSILTHGRSQEADAQLMPVKEIISLIDTGKPDLARPMTELVRDFIDPREFCLYLKSIGVDFYTGVPDSLLKDICSCFAQQENHAIVANEGSAIALAAGYHLATGKVPLVYMQNSGLGNAINPLLSLADPKVYGVPMLLLIGWRGQPGKKDEPQHMVQGARMRDMLDAMKIPFATLPDFLEGEGGAAEIVNGALSVAKRNSQPFALLVKRQTFTPFESQDQIEHEGTLSREETLRICINRLGEHDVVVGTTGFTSREIYTIRDEMGGDHSKDFLTVGSMGHASAIALGVAMQTPYRNVICFDGDGATLMHMGNISTVASLSPKNFKHVLINNGVHDSVGGQATGLSAGSSLATTLGYKWSRKVTSEEDLVSAFDELLKSDGPGMLEVMSKPGARSDLGRPRTTPVANKKSLMAFLAGTDQL